MRVVVIAVTYTCVAQLTHMSHGTHTYVWFDWLNWVAWPIYMPHIWAWHGLTKYVRWSVCVNVTCLIIYKSRDVFVFVTWFIRMTHVCDYCDSYECESHLNHMFRSYESYECESHLNHIWISFESHLNLIWITFESHLNLIWITFESHLNHMLWMWITFESRFLSCSLWMWITLESHVSFIWVIWMWITFESHVSFIWVICDCTAITYMLWLIWMKRCASHSYECESHLRLRE